jgi:hypothetical protein
MGQSPFAVNRGVILEKYLFDLGAHKDLGHAQSLSLP